MLASRATDSVPLIPTLLSGSHPVSPHVHDINGNTALHHASAAGELKALRMLLQAGASPSAQNAFSWTPIAYSATVQAEVYFKNLITEVDRFRASGGVTGPASAAMVAGSPGRGLVGSLAGTSPGSATPPPRRPMAGGVRLVTEDVMGVREGEVSKEWSPVERRRAMTPTAGRSEWAGGEAESRARANTNE